jgi:hypothetical protein
MCRKKFNLHSNPTRITSTLHEDQCMFCNISRSVLLRMVNISEENRTFYEIMWKNKVQPVGPQIKI